MNEAFEFRLGRVLDYRQQKEKEAKNQLAKALGSLQDAKCKLDLLMKEKQRVVSCSEAADKINVQEKVLQIRYCDHLDTRIGSQNESIVGKEHEVLDRRKELVKKSQDKQTLEALKERQYSSYVRERNRVEQKENDEMAVNRFRFNHSRN
jgi:flagellar protein FliJ